MGTLKTVESLWALWKQGKVKADHVMGQLLQYLMDLQKELAALELEVRKLKRQVEELSSKT